jgi:hypothetical protein
MRTKALKFIWLADVRRHFQAAQTTPPADEDAVRPDAPTTAEMKPSILQGGDLEPEIRALYEREIGRLRGSALIADYVRTILRRSRR